MDVDDKSGVEEVFGFLTRRERRKVEGGWCAYGSVLYNLLRMSVGCAESGSDFDEEDFFTTDDATVAGMVGTVGR